MISVQIQSVLYKNNKSSILRSLQSLVSAHSYEAARANDAFKTHISYGDASPDPVLNDDDVKAIRDTLPRDVTFQYTFFNENTGTAKGHNRLANNYKEGFIAIINPDILVTPTFFERMLEPFTQTDRDVGLVEARQTPIEHQKCYDTKTGITSWASTAAVLINAEYFHELGGFDEKTFFMYCDDVDFSWRLRMSGKSVVYQPRAPVFHAKTLSVDGSWQPTKAEAYYSAEAHLLMTYKWSREDLCNEIISIFLKSDDEALNRAANTFIERKKRGEVPEQVDADNAIGTFVGYNYAEHRFTI